MASSSQRDAKKVGHEDTAEAIISTIGTSTPTPSLNKDPQVGHKQIVPAHESLPAHEVIATHEVISTAPRDAERAGKPTDATTTTSTTAAATTSSISWILMEATEETAAGIKIE
uniref:Uncharacterized protein n=1 Tax=Lotharella oceanica TaxID=641309 RepID=A0A7S2TKQ0_9EUKA|mmetsp:Transcript_17114/g.32478  ORF Transcript_17114/g.32478 Transcript_17114/m.32478 type:complete len:114 (+) Transcript_17114:735-1076(+)